MTIKHVGDNGELEAFKKLRRAKRNKVHVYEDFDTAINFNVNGGEDGGMWEKVEDSFQYDSPNLKEILELDYQMHLKS